MKKKITTSNRTQSGQEIPNWSEDQARDYFERRRWGDSPACVHCGSVNVYRVGGEKHRVGLLECKECRKQFTVTVGTIMEDSHLPLATWARAFHLLSTSKKGFSSLQLQRNLGLGSYRTAWFLAHRIREAMRTEPVAGMLKNQVQIDEVYIGPSRGGKYLRKGEKPRKRGRGTTTKVPVVALVETGGKVHAEKVSRVNSDTIGELLKKTCEPTAEIVTDELQVYKKLARNHLGPHSVVNHGSGEFVGKGGANTNSAESFFALLKRGIHGTFHHISTKHMNRYCDEFSFRWNGRGLTDTERRDDAVKGVEGKRLVYKKMVN